MKNSKIPFTVRFTLVFAVFVLGFFWGRNYNYGDVLVSKPWSRWNPAPIYEETLGTLPADDGLININTASASELMELPGIGESLAESIVQYRQDRGYFVSIEELQAVPGIGEERFQQLKHLIKVGG